MIRWLRNRLAWLVAEREMAELERWRVECDQVRRWMAEFPDVCTALDHLEAFASGRPYRGLSEVREGMRRRRDVFVRMVAPVVYPAPGLNGWRPERATPVQTDWDVTAQAYMADMRTLEDLMFATPETPTHFPGIAKQS